MYEIGPLEYGFKSSPKKIICPKKINIEKNELVIIAGPSGSGKSTLLQLLKGIIPEFSSGVLSGTLLYKGHPLHGEYFETNLRDILFLFQNPFSQLVFPKACEEFFFSMENFNFTREEMDQRKEELKNYFDLDHLWDKKTTELSTGECQRLVLSSLLAIDPEVLLLDEPTAFLDPEARLSFYAWLTKMKGSRTIIIVDHHLDEILPFADKIIQVDAAGMISTVQSLPIESLTQMSFPQIEVGLKKEIELNVDKLFFHYADQDRLLEDITLNARASDIVVIKGKNGKGKSTLFKLMASLIKPLKGKVQLCINHKNIPVNRQYKEIGFIFQNPESHFFYDTIEEELKLKSTDTKMYELLDIFFKNIDYKRSPFLLSEGEKRRLSILMTVFHDKSLLFYDEPTFGQDKTSIAIIREIILYLKQRGMVQFIISHDEAFINSLDAREFELRNCHLVEIK